jgi:two-component system OmpR family sensor kinase
MRRRMLPWLLALAPAAVAVAVWIASRTGALTDERIEIRLSALRGDWLLAGGLVLSALACGALLLAARRDARWRRRLAEQVAASARERHLLLSRLDHELKNPLTAMRAALANVTAGAPGPERATGLSSIETQVLRLSRLTADLRKIADVESSPVDRRLLEVAPLLEEAVEVAGEQPAAADRVLTLDLPRAPWPLPQVSGDGDLLTLAFVNLVDNAIKFTGPGGRIEVRAREAAGRVVVEVADTGPGIGSDELPHIWEELYRGPRGRAVPGSGLGLALVRAVVERHGGSVGVESRMGQGTVVRLELPGEPRDGARPAAVVAPPQKAADPAT